MANDDNLLPAAEVTKRYGVSAMTIYRWSHSSELGFPQPTRINKRRYWRVSELVDWERSRAPSSYNAKEPAHVEA